MLRVRGGSGSRTLSLQYCRLKQREQASSSVKVFLKFYPMDLDSSALRITVISPVLTTSTSPLHRYGDSISEPETSLQDRSDRRKKANGISHFSRLKPLTMNHPMKILRDPSLTTLFPITQRTGLNWNISKMNSRQGSWTFPPRLVWDRGE
jgi:hypothetical protein